MIFKQQELFLDAETTRPCGTSLSFSFFFNWTALSSGTNTFWGSKGGDKMFESVNTEIYNRAAVGYMWISIVQKPPSTETHHWNNCGVTSSSACNQRQTYIPLIFLLSLTHSISQLHLKTHFQEHHIYPEDCGIHTCIYLRQAASSPPEHQRWIITTCGQRYRCYCHIGVWWIILWGDTHK